MFGDPRESEIIVWAGHTSWITKWVVHIINMINWGTMVRLAFEFNQQNQDLQLLHMKMN